MRRAALIGGREVWIALSGDDAPDGCRPHPQIDRRVEAARQRRLQRSGRLPGDAGVAGGISGALGQVGYAGGVDIPKGRGDQTAGPVGPDKGADGVAHRRIDISGRISLCDERSASRAADEPAQNHIGRGCGGDRALRIGCGDRAAGHRTGEAAFKCRAEHIAGGGDRCHRPAGKDGAGLYPDIAADIAGRPAHHQTRGDRAGNGPRRAVQPDAAADRALPAARAGIGHRAGRRPCHDISGILAGDAAQGRGA